MDQGETRLAIYEAAKTIDQYLIEINNGKMNSEDFYWWNAVLDILNIFESDLRQQMDVGTAGMRSCESTGRKATGD